MNEAGWDRMKRELRGKIASGGPYQTKQVVTIYRDEEPPEAWEIDGYHLKLRHVQRSQYWVVGDYAVYSIESVPESRGDALRERAECAE